MKTTNLKRGYLIRYADDWVLVTNTKTNAIRWKTVISNYLRKELKLELSEDKTKITNIRKKPIEFLGFKYKVVKRGIKNRNKNNKKLRFISVTSPREDKIAVKVKELRSEIKTLGKKLNHKKINTARLIINYNSKVRGLINYYSFATENLIMDKEGYKLKKVSYHVLSKRGCESVPINQCINLKDKYPDRTHRTMAIKTEIGYVGMMILSLCSMNEALYKQKVQEETPYSPAGRLLIEKRKEKRDFPIRRDEITSLNLLDKITRNLVSSPRYNFEYFMNRGYAFNRDRGKCRITGAPLDRNNLHVHHINPNLPLYEVNKLTNLVCVHKTIHVAIHNNDDLSNILNSKQLKKLSHFREKLIG